MNAKLHFQHPGIDVATVEIYYCGPFRAMPLEGLLVHWSLKRPRRGGGGQGGRETDQIKSRLLVDTCMSQFFIFFPLLLLTSDKYILYAFVYDRFLLREFGDNVGLWASGP